MGPGVTPYLCDTHTLLWWAQETNRLGGAVRAILADPTTDILVSPVTPWELSMKYRIGKLAKAEPIVTAYAETLRRLGAVSLPITDDHALLAGRLSWGYRDPFDRMLAAQAILEGAVLLSADVVFDTLPRLRRVW